MFSKESIQNKPKEVELLRREISINLQLSHELIAKMEEFHETEGSLYLVFELLEGTPIISSRTPTLKTVDEVREVIGNLLKALLHLEKKKIVHRDLKPYNILYQKNQKNSNDKTLKLIDFGLATSHSAPRVLYRQCGTPGFIAPEVFKTSRTNFHSILNSKLDVFSVGIIFHYLTFAIYPFGEDDSDVIFERNKKGDFQICGMDEHVLESEDLYGYKLMTLMLARDPEERPSMEEALQHPFFSRKKDKSDIFSGRTTKPLTATIKSSRFGSKGKMDSKPVNKTNNGLMDKIFRSSKQNEDEFGMEEVGEDESEFDVGGMDEGKMMAIRNFGIRAMMPKNKFKEF